MNNTNRFEVFPGTAVWLLPALLAVSAGAAEVPPAAAPAEPKTHTLFMGSDVSIERGSKLYRVKDVAGSSFIIHDHGEIVKVPMRGDKHNLKIEQALKLTADSASLTGLKSERAYTPGSDPRMRRQREEAQANSVVTDNAALAIGQFRDADNHFGTGINSVKAPTSYENLEAIVADTKAKTSAEGQFIENHLLSSDLTNASFARLKANEDLAQELFDAVQVNFEVSAATPLSSPYVVVITRFREKGAKPGEVRDAILAKGLDPIGEKPRSVELMQGGFPRGFAIEDVQVHLYNLGQEVATDVAPKRVPLTRDEAFKYVKIDYFSNHKGATLPATPALGKLDADEKSRLTSAQLSDPYFVKVSKNGLPEATYVDEACTKEVDPVVAALVTRVRFYPALDKGKAVEGVARLLFTQLTI